MIKIIPFISLLCSSQITFAITNNDLKELTPKLLKLARTELKYSKPVDPPQIIAQTEKQLTKRFRPRKKCTVSGIYSMGVIYIDKRIKITNEIDKSILCHEFVHHVQAQMYGTTYDCKLWRKKEKQAYPLQKKYFKSRGIKTDFISQIIAELRCPDE
jgi:hypothetical protein